MTTETSATGSAIPFPATINALTSLRYIAAFWVLIFHFKEFFPDSILVDVEPLRLGFLGVDFFFVLSGFVLAHVYLKKMEARRFDYWSFIVRRVARIYPLHLLTLGLTIGLSILGLALGWQYSLWDLAAWRDMPLPQTFRELFAHVMLIHAWGATQGLGFNAPSWTISAEWFAYLFFPVMALALTFRKFPAWAGVIICLILMAGLELVHQQFFDRSLFRSTWNIGALRIIPTFALGIALRRVGEGFSFGSSLAFPAFLASFAALALLLVVSAPLILIVLALSAIVFTAADAERHGHLALLCKPFPVLMGEISYSVYLIHYPVGIVLLDIFVRPLGISSLWGSLAWIFAAAIGITILSWLSHKFFEAPARRLLIAAGKRGQPELAPPPDK